MPGPKSVTFVLRGIFILTVLALACSLASQWIREAPLPWFDNWSRYVESKAEEAGIRVITLEEVEQISATMSHLILDARTMADYDAGHIPGAMALPASDMDTYAPMVLPVIRPEDAIMVYCSGVECDESLDLGRYLMEQGYTNVVLFAGGYTAWEQREGTGTP